MSKFPFPLITPSNLQEAITNDSGDKCFCWEKFCACIEEIWREFQLQQLPNLKEK